MKSVLTLSSLSPQGLESRLSVTPLREVTRKSSGEGGFLPKLPLLPFLLRILQLRDHPLEEEEAL